jgi:hypothetical protein
VDHGQLLDRPGERDVEQAEALRRPSGDGIRLDDDDRVELEALGVRRRQDGGSRCAAGARPGRAITATDE